MRRSDPRAALTDEVARFQAEVRRLALHIVQAVIAQELDRKRAKLRPARSRPEKSRRAATSVVPQAVAPEPAPAPATAALEQPADPGGSRKRGAWTREAIVSELASWLLSGTAIDATFVARHGPPGLVAAARRTFGRFEAALNVAALHVSKLYPDGPPER